MQNYAKIALERLKEARFKITPARRVIVEFLSKSRKALSPYEIRDILKKRGISNDVVTIYRILELLENMGLVHKVLGFNGYVRCGEEEKSKERCHHYLLCRKCRTVEEVYGEDLAGLEKKIARKKKFSVESHYLEFKGLCSNCA